MASKLDNIDKNLVKANIWDYVSYTVAIYAVWIGPTALLIYPPWFLSMTASTLCLGLVILVGEATDRAEKIRRDELDLPPRSGLRDISIKRMSVHKQFLHLLFIPLLLFIPVGWALFYITNFLVFIFGLVLGLDLFPTSVKIVYVAALLIIVLPIYFFRLNQRFSQNHSDWWQSNNQNVNPQ